MSNLMQALDARRFPLHGLRLIEASAGTGKTFTIAALYLRLVLGHGGFERALGPASKTELAAQLLDLIAERLR